MAMNDRNAPAQTLAMRLIFEYEGDQVRLVSQQPVDMVITGFDLPQSQHDGFFVDTRNAAGRQLARVPARGAFSGSAEVFPEKHDEPITRVDVERPRGAFTVVVPVPKGADHVAVVRVAPPAKEKGVAATHAAGTLGGAAETTDLAQFPLRLSR